METSFRFKVSRTLLVVAACFKLCHPSPKSIDWCSMSNQQDMTIPTEFTVEQLERMAELAASANAARPNPQDHNLARKLTEYYSVAARFHGFRRAG